LPNGFAGGSLLIPDVIRRDDRVRVLDEAAHVLGVGDLKKRCCDAAQGDLLVELDHDDMLDPRALMTLAGAAAKAPDGFYYSDCAYFTDSDRGQQPVLFDKRMGWETYALVVPPGEPARTAHRAWPVSPRSLCELLFAPDHVRCWSRKAYEASLGHDPTKALGDDLDLLIRTYLAGVPFVHVQDCLYYYRYHGANTSQVRNAEIQTMQSQLRDAYLSRLIEAWITRNDLYAWTPEPGDYCGMGRRASSSLGHLTLRGDFLPMLTGDQTTLCFNEAHRLLQPGGYLTIEAPYANGALAHAPHYRSHWNRRTLDYYTDKEYASRLPGNAARFQLIRYALVDETPDEPLAYRLRMRAELISLKDHRPPGLIRI
jgi:hypothetical protein